MGGAFRRIFWVRSSLGLSSTGWILSEGECRVEAWRGAQAVDRGRSAGMAQLVSTMSGRPKLSRNCRTNAMLARRGCSPRCK